MHLHASRRPVLLAAASLVVACHHQPPAIAAVAKPVTDDGAQSAAAQARQDSIERARAARDDAARAAATADSARRAADALRTADADARQSLLAPIHFDFDRAEILPGDQAVLDRKAAIMAANPGLRIHIDGNTDERGSDEYNLALGMRRAGEVRQYLSNHGIDATRLSIASNGEERPACQEHGESCWSQNRRDEFVIVAGGARIVAVR
jgi:peptidoglycan-associated lipoprotein